MSIREKVIEIAERKGFDYKKLADASGLPRPTVHRYFNGKADLTGGRIDKLLGVLGLAVGRYRRTAYMDWTSSHYPGEICLQHDVSCGPCMRHVCPYSHHRCMRDLTVDRVYHAVVRQLQFGRRQAA